MEQQKKYDVFISYARKDSVIADEICQAFDRVGVTYFIDRKGMGGTANYVTKIAEEIDNSKAMLLLASGNSYKSKYVSIELHYAFNHDVVVLPYALDETPVPKDFEILLIHANWHYYNEDPIIPNLLASVSELVNKTITPIFTPEPTPTPAPMPKPTPKPNPKSPHKPINRSWIWLTIATLAIIGLVIIGVRHFQQRSVILNSPVDIEQEQIVQVTFPKVQTQDSIAKITKTNSNTTKSTEIATTNNTTVVSTVSKEKSDAKSVLSKAQAQDGVAKESKLPSQARAKSTMVNYSATVVPTSTKEEPINKASQTLNAEELEKAKRNALPKGEFQVGDLMYKASEKGSGVTVAKYVHKDIKVLSIPSKIQYGKYTYDVDAIGKSAFYDCDSLTSITIPNSVTSIGNYAFFWCRSLTSITIPNSVTSIGASAFHSCPRLISIVVEKGNKMFDSRENCNAIIETATNALIQGCNSTIIPNSVTSIGESAFSYCSSLTSITIPNSVMSVGDRVFSGCHALTLITVESGNKMYDSRENCNAIIHTASNTLIAGCKNTVIPNSVKSIGKNAFYGCWSLTSITIPNSVTSIGERAFCFCSGLTSITIPKSLTNIGENAFSEHTKIIRK